MQLRDLIASLSLLSGCCPQEEIWHSRSVVLPPMPDAQLAMLIDACVDRLDCDPLCEHDWGEYAPDHYGDEIGSVRKCTLTVTASERTLSYEGLELCAAGRRPHRYRAPRLASPTAGAYFAVQAALEAASVQAFADLLADLIVHRAPVELQHAARCAAADEVRHARACEQLARRHGAACSQVVTAPAPRRSLLELAVENAAEGCTRETAGAAVAAWQARTSADPAVRAALATIAREETRHAELAWALQRWLAPRLTRGERAAVVDAARCAI